MQLVRLRMPIRFMRGNYGSLALTVGAIACGVALICSLSLCSGAVLRAFVEVVDTMAGRTALRVVAGEGGLFHEEVAEQVGAVPGVEVAIPVVLATAFVADGSGEVLSIQGVDLTYDETASIYGSSGQTTEWLDDALAFVTQPDSVALDRAFALRRGLALGDELELVTPAGRGSFTVRALFEPEGVARAYADHLVVMDLYAAEESYTREGFITGVDVVIDREANLDDVQKAVNRVLPPGLRTETPEQRRAELQKVMRSMPVMLNAIALFSLVAAFLITFNRLSTVFERRVWQAGALRAIGLRRRVVRWELVKEGFLIGVVGAAIGIPLGIALGRRLLPVVASTAGLAYRTVAPAAELSIHTGAVALAAAIGIAAALFAVLLPAHRASRVSVVETLGHRGAEQSESGGQSSVLWKGALLVSIAVAITAQAAIGWAGFGLMATVLIAAGTAVASKPLIALAGRVHFRLSRMGAPSFRFASGYLLQNPRRTSLTVATISVCLACIVWFWTIATSFERSLVDVMTAAFRADLYVTSSHLSAGYVEAPVGEDLIARLKSVPEIADAGGVRVADWRYAGERISIEAIEDSYFTHPNTAGQFPLVGDSIANLWGRLARGGAIIVSSNLAVKFDMRVGETLVLDTPNGRLELLVGAVTSAFESSFGTVFMGRAVYRRYWNDYQVNRIGLVARPHTDLGLLRETIARDLGPDYHLRIFSPHELIDHFVSQARRGFATLRLLAMVVLLVGLLGIADTLAAGVLERTRQIGTLRAVGIRRGHAVSMVIIEALMMGVLGLVLAVGSGLALALLWVKQTLPLLLGWVVDFHVPFQQLPLLVAMVAIASLIAALLPARYVVRLQPTASLRYE